MFLTIFPKHLILFILDEWLCSWNDFSSMDLAMTNKELRFYFYAPNSSSQDSIRKINKDITIRISSGMGFESLLKWKEKRLLEITKLCLDFEYNEFGRCMLGNTFPTLIELEIIDSCDVELQHIFYGNLPNLKRCCMQNGSICICPETLNKTFPVTNIKELLLNNVKYTLISGVRLRKVRRVWNVSLADCTKLYLWMAKCCPQLTKLHLNHCYGTHYANIIPMLHALPALKEFSYRVSRDSLNLLLTNSPESAATFRDIAPLSAEGINGDRQYHLPRITSLDIDIDEIPDDSWLVKQVWEVMFQGCDLRELQTLALGLDNDIPLECYDRLMNFLLEEGHRLKSICLDIVDENTSPLLAAICKSCTSLEHWKLKNLTIQDSLLTCLTHPNTLPRLLSLSLYIVCLNNASMEMICRSSVANQLTKLSLIDASSLSLETYHLMAHSFPRLKFLEIEMPLQQQEVDDDVGQYRSIVQWLDELFSRRCVFANTIETISLNIQTTPRKYCLNWTTTENAALANELFYDHMLKHWYFPFPALQSFAMIWTINHQPMNGLMMRRLLNCPKLHSIKLDLGEFGRCSAIMNIKNQPEVIRQMREGY